jgi:putative Mg2+ transporter-C (MgtC) family protein
MELLWHELISGLPDRHIKGLTTAAGLWITAAIGIAVGLGVLGVAIIGTLLTVIVLSLVGVIESRLRTS